MTWTRTAPKRPGKYRCRFLPAPGIDPEPFQVELVEDTINGGVVAKDRHGLLGRLEVAYPNCEWQEVTIEGLVEQAMATTCPTLIVTHGDMTWSWAYIVERRLDMIRIADAPAATPHAAVAIADIKNILLLCVPPDGPRPDPSPLRP